MLPREARSVTSRRRLGPLTVVDSIQETGLCSRDLFGLPMILVCAMRSALHRDLVDTACTTT